MVGVEVNAVPIVGQPVAFGVGFLVLVFFAFSGLFGRYFMVFAHEGGHILAGKLILRRLLGFWLYDDGTGLTLIAGRRWALGNLFFVAVGYATPPLLGLAAAGLIAAGNPLAVLLIAALASLAAVIPARNGLAFLIPLVLVVGLTFVLLRGTAFLQAAIAVGIAWFLLISGGAAALDLRGRKGDSASLARKTLVPAAIWELLWAAVGLVALVAGGRLLLVP